MLLLAGSVLQGCSSDEIEVPAQELYAREFIKTFGAIDPRQDWTAAQKSEVTVKTAAPTRVKVIAEFNGKQYLFADYSEVSGTERLTFDLPKGVTDLTIRANGRDITTTVGSTVDLTQRGSRGYIENEIVVANEGEYMYFEPDVIKRYVSAEIDESTPNGYVGEVPEEIQNINNPSLVENFWMVSQGPFVTYPIYWMSSLCHEVGIYYIPAGMGLDDGIHVPFHRNKFFEGGCDDLQTTSTYWPSQEDPLNLHAYIYFDSEKKPLLNEDGSYMQPTNIASTADSNANNVKVGATLSNGKKISRIDYGEIVEDASQWFYQIQGYCSYSQEIIAYEQTEPTFGAWNKAVAQSSGTEYDYFRSQAYTIKVPEGCRFCFYIDAYEGGVTAESNQQEGQKYLEGHKFLRRVYSSATMNEHVGHIPHTQTTNPDRKHSWAVHCVAEVNGQDYTYWSFEDWGGRNDENTTVDNSKPIDLNDLVWVIASDYPPEKPYIPPTVDTVDPGDDTPDPFTWIVACEDLGGTYDYDFNDVVFGVQYTAGDTDNRVYVTALAAGGTLPVHLYYNGVELTGKGDLDQRVEAGDRESYAEWHNWFGSASSQVVNVRGDFKVGATISFVPDNLPAGEEFSMSADLDVAHDFTVRVENGSGITEIKRPTAGGEPGDLTPQMFVTTLNFQWPKEKVPIYATHRGTGADLGKTVNRFGEEYGCYEHGFQHWVEDATAEFHTKGLSHADQTINHGWKGYTKPATTPTE